MKKERFIYELIDNYLYYVNLINIVMENYTSKERTTRNLDVAIQGLKSCLVFYDALSREIEMGNVDRKEADEKLEYVIASFNKRAKDNVIEELKRCWSPCISDIGSFLQSHLFFDSKGKKRTITNSTMEEYLVSLREQEEENMKDCKK